MKRVRFRFSRWTMLAALACAPLFITGCDDDTSSVTGIIRAVFDLVLNIIELAD